MIWNILITLMIPLGILSLLISTMLPKMSVNTKQMYITSMIGLMLMIVIMTF